MTTDSGFTGRRLPDTAHGDLPIDLDQLRPGDIWRVTSRGTGEPLVASRLYPDTDMSGNLTDGVWMAMTPAGLATLSLHTVREHDDDTVSIRPGDGSSNSVLVSGGPKGLSWHGYVEHNVWTAC